mmetsp:Transcript_25820/g.56985  ORF Transcript_25820/g.56985 Transcript_25820/m.56985 type:complete len:215 (-) Transcript_25820:130-774(-)
MFEEPCVLAAANAIEAVVATHDSVNGCLSNHRLEGSQVNLMQSPLVYHGVARVAICFLLIANQVLHTGRHVALRSADPSNSTPGGEVGVLRVTLEVAPSDRVSLQVHSRPQDHVRTSSGALLADQVSHLLQQFLIEGSRQRHLAGPCRCANFAVHAKTTCSVRPVGEAQCRQPKALYAPRLPHTFSTEEADLFGVRELLQNRLSLRCWTAVAPA